MQEGYEDQATDAPGLRAGTMLRDARTAAGLELADVSAQTRIPARHLAAIEAGEYAGLPSRTYAIGFSRTYARTLGLDEKAVTDRVREELAEGDPQAPGRPDRFEPGDPARVPSSRLAWFSALAVVVLVVGAFTFYRTYFSPGLGPPPLTAPQLARVGQPPHGQGTQPAAVAVAAATGPVVFTSLMDGTWVKFYDGDGQRLYEAQMAKGDSFTVPADAKQPMVWTGRPYALAITVGGREVPKLSDADTVVKDVPVTAEALLARGATSAPPASAGSAPPPA